MEPKLINIPALSAFAKADNKILGDSLFPKLRQLEDDFLEEIMTMVLGRKPEPDEVSKFSYQYKVPLMPGYTLFFDKITIGYITIKHTEHTWQFMFEPA